MDPDRLRGKMLFWGTLTANIGASILILITRWIIVFQEEHHGVHGDNSGLYTLTSFLFIPLGMGMVGAYFLKDVETKPSTPFLSSLYNLLLGLALSVVLLQEGVICLVMASPLLYTMFLIGYLIGQAFFRRIHRKLHASIAPILLLLMAVDILSPHRYHNQVTDQIVIHAPPERVWQYIPDYPAIQTPPDFWLWRIGLPAPVQSTTTAHRVGAERQCVFLHGVVVGEKMVAYEPMKELTFEVTRQPNDPEVLNHFVLERGQFLLKDNGDGTTTVTGTSWYRLNVYPICYFDLWTQSIIRRVHLRVMRHIQSLAETPTMQSHE